MTRRVGGHKGSAAVRPSHASPRVAPPPSRVRLTPAAFILVPIAAAPQIVTEELTAARRARIAAADAAEDTAALSLRSASTQSSAGCRSLPGFVSGIQFARVATDLIADAFAKAAAEKLSIHVNTAHYRLGRIAEKTGCDLRRLSDVIDRLIAVRLAHR
jgi:PucR C-terminal helix-turn-helix domain